MTNLRCMNACVTAVVAVMAMLSPDTITAAESNGTLSPAAVEEIAQVEAEIDHIEAQALERLAALPSNQVQQIELLGKLMLYDKHLSVNRMRPVHSAIRPKRALPARCRS